MSKKTAKSNNQHWVTEPDGYIEPAVVTGDPVGGLAPRTIPEVRTTVLFYYVLFY